MKSRLKILVRGIVQGVGFRPFIYNLAESLNLKGTVLNSSEGVIIELEGENSHEFLERMKSEAPPLSQIMSVEVEELPYYGFKDFQILESKDEGKFTLISPDVSICNDCLREMLDKNDRRYLYPFINCTNCGPRYTITKRIPYDRPNTTMSVFKMCPVCDKEYHDPRNRRFHAQPNACPVCGPNVELVSKKERKNISKNESPILETIKLLKQGDIVAIKGLGGFHLACDATNEDAVNRLRLKKRKSNKPFALMAPNIQSIKKFCIVTPEQEEILISNKRPIVLLKKRNNILPDAISPLNPYIGFMLPYTPLHYLLFYYPYSEVLPNFDALVMTSGNISEEPIVINNQEAVTKLSNIADAFLLHNRDIFMRVDDSVLQVLSQKKIIDNINSSKEKPRYITYFIRRSRGYVPDPIPLHDDGPEVLGCGADIKNIFTLTKGRYAIPSQHIGDMENFETLQFFEETLNNLKSVYRVKPVALAYDLHPMYLSTQWALRQNGIKKLGIQHHYAHVASVMAEKGIKSSVIGVSFDGTGYGLDGNLWGGEFIIADLEGFIRACHFSYVPLPGGEGAIKDPWKISISYLKDSFGNNITNYIENIGFVKKYTYEKIEMILKILEDKQFSPLSSGAGRLFDAISALIGVCDKNTFEGEAAIALESIAETNIKDAYPFEIKTGDIMEVDFKTTIRNIVKDFIKNKSKGLISARFHNTIVEIIHKVVKELRDRYSLNDIILCGGVFQNLYLLEKTLERLREDNFKLHIHEKVPTNDAGISLGQAYILRERVKKGII